MVSLFQSMRQMWNFFVQSGSFAVKSERGFFRSFHFAIHFCAVPQAKLASKVGTPLTR